MARIEISNDPSGRITISFPYDPLLVAKVKTIDGRRWHPEEKHWSFRRLDGVLEKILKVFEDEDIYIDPALKGTVPDFVVSAQSNDLRTDNHSIPPLEKRGEGGFESGLSPKFYTHVSNKDLMRIKNPLDQFLQKEGGGNPEVETQRWKPRGGNPEVETQRWKPIGRAKRHCHLSLKF